MKLLLANRHFSAFLFPPLEPGQFVRNWFRLGSNGKGNHVETPFAKPPPVVFWKNSQIAFAEARCWSRALAQHGAARVTADDVGHAAAEHVVFCECGREAAVEDLSICGSVVERDADQTGHVCVPSGWYNLDADPENIGQQKRAWRHQAGRRSGIRTTVRRDKNTICDAAIRRCRQPFRALGAAAKCCECSSI